VHAWPRRHRLPAVGGDPSGNGGRRHWRFRQWAITAPGDPAARLRPPLFGRFPGDQPPI